MPGLEKLRAALAEKAEAFSGDRGSIGRTHLMDATPLTLGQEFSGYTMQVAKAMERTDRAILALQELAVGGTAVGTGINCHPKFPGQVCAQLNAETGLQFSGDAKSISRLKAVATMAVEVAGLLSTIAASLSKIEMIFDCWALAMAQRLAGIAFAGHTTGQLHHAGQSEPRHERDARAVVHLRAGPLGDGGDVRPRRPF